MTEIEYRFRYHTYIRDESLDHAELARSQSKRLKFLSRKLIEDMKSGDRIFVRKGQGVAEEAEALQLLAGIRRYGQAWLLWVVEADEDHPAGSVEIRQHGLLKGYIDRFSPLADAGRFSAAIWLELYRQAYVLVRTGSDQSITAAKPDHNLIEGAETFGGWYSSPFAVSDPAWGVKAPRGEASVMRHILIRDATPGTHQVYFWARKNGFAGREFFKVSAWVWLPGGFSGTQVAIGVGNCEVLKQVSADLQKRDCWQQVSLHGRMPPQHPDAVVCLYALGSAGPSFYSSCWRLEEQDAPSS